MLTESFLSSHLFIFPNIQFVVDFVSFVLKKRKGMLLILV